MGILFLAALLGIVPAMIASSKGRSGFLWWIYGAALFIVALPHSILLKPEKGFEDQRALRDGGRKCPDCAEIVRSEARKCRFCGSVLATNGPEPGYERIELTTWQKLWWNPYPKDR